MKQFGSYMLYKGEHMGSNNTSAAAAGPVSVPVDFRFHPKEEELVKHYLRNKLQGMDYHILEIDVCKYEPSALPALLVAETETETRAPTPFAPIGPPKNYRQGCAIKTRHWEEEDQISKLRASTIQTQISKVY